MNIDLNKYTSTKYILELYKKYLPHFLGKKNKGLFLLPTQTGSGKTHATSEIIVETILNHEEINIIYLINSKDERKEMYKKIISHAKNEEEKKTLEKNVLMLKSNEDYLFDAFEKDYRFKYISKLKEFNNLKKKIELFSNIRKFNKEDLYDSYRLEDSSLKGKLQAIYKNPKKYGYSHKEVINIINDAKKLYPTISMNSRAIITTTQKFLKKIYDVRGSYYLFDKNKEKTIIFIDEFDTQKNTILDVFIKEVAKKGIDIFELIKIVSETLHTDTINKYFAPNDFMHDIKKDIDKFYKKYNLEYKVKFNSLEDNENSYFLKDTSSFTISKRFSNYIYSTNTKKSTNYVNEIDKIKNEETNFLKVYEEADKLIVKFFGAIKSLIINSKKENGKSENSQETTDTIYNFLYEFLTGTDTQVHTIVDRVLREQKKSSRHKFFQSELDKSHSNLYSMLTFKNDEKHENFTRFYNYTLDNTPDAFLSYLSKNFFIVGISATATIPTKIYNFDLEFLSDSLIEIEDKERLKLKKIYHKTKLVNREYKASFLDTFSFSSIDEMSKSLVKKSIYQKDDKFFKYIWDETYYLNNSSSNYHLSRYLEFVYLYKEYCMCEKIKTFLYLVSFNFDERMDLNLLNTMIHYMLIDNYSKLPKIKQLGLKKISLLEKKDIENKSYSLESLGIHFAKAKGNKEWKEKLKKGLLTKIFLISSYAYMAKGQNIDYPHLPEGEKESINKDFDAIYCGEITNLMATKIDNDYAKKEELLLKLLHDTTILQNNGDISLSEKKEFLKKVMRGNEWNRNIYMKTNDYIDACMIFIIQAIGRLHRTNYAGTINMFFHHQNRRTLEYFNPYGHLLLPAIEHSINEAKNSDIHEIEKTNNIDINTKNINIKNNLSYFNAVIHNPSSSRKEINAAIKEWEELRSYILRNPTIPKLGNSEHRYFTASTTKYWYKEENDYEKIIVSNSYLPEYSEVSIENSRIKKIHSIKELKECFKIHEIAIDFKYKNIMTPIIYNNFYKGAIGEVFGKYIFENFAKINLESINYNSKAPFELFDFTNSDESIYIDFKYFSTYTAAEIQKERDIVQNVKNKLLKNDLSPNAIFIINLFVDIENNDMYSNKIKEEENIYLVPWLIRENKEGVSLDYNMLTNIKELYDKHINK